MSKAKPPLVKYPIRLQKNGSKKIIYRVIKDVQRLRNNHKLGTAIINKQSQMVRQEGICWVIV